MKFFYSAGRLYCTNRLKGGRPLPRTDLFYGLRDGYAKGDVTVEHRDPDLELADLSVEVPTHEALAKEFDAAHLRLCTALSVITGQLSPQGPRRVDLDFERSEGPVSALRAHGPTHAAQDIYALFGLI